MMNVPAINLGEDVKSYFPAELADFIRTAGEAAGKEGQRLYLVGGVVRDILLGRANFDIDLVVEGDAIKVALQMAHLKQAKIVTHSRFGTATLRWREWSVDLATARSETYAKPGALPAVKPGSIDSDLFRRDFTVNAMAIGLDPLHYGELLDLYGGMADLERRLLRVLHEKSFIDDATRIWRALRYEQRLNFRLEAGTLRLLKRDLPMLDTISGDRIRHELELVLKEEFPEKVILRAARLGVLSRLHPSLAGDGWLAEKFEQARHLLAPDLPPVSLYIELLAYRLTVEEGEQLISCLKLPKAIAKSLREVLEVKRKLGSLSVSGLAPSRVYSLLHGYSPTALTACSIAADSTVAGDNIRLYLDALRHVKPALSGDDLKKLGVTSGPQIRELLEKLREARLDGKVSSKREEEEMVRAALPL